MKRDYNRLNLGSITVRLPTSMIIELDSKCAYGERSDLIRDLITLALRVESLMKIQKDPLKKQEFEEKFASLLQEKDIEKSLETMNPDQLRGISFFLENLKNKKVQILLDELKTN